YLISDRTFFRLERGERFDREVYPAELEAPLARLLPSRADRAQRLDLLYWAAAARLRAERPPDLEAVYLPGLDIFTAPHMTARPSARCWPATSCGRRSIPPSRPPTPSARWRATDAASRPPPPAGSTARCWRSSARSVTYNEDAAAR